MAESGLQRTGEPVWLEPAKATLTRERFSDPGWVFERKLDGERSLAYVRDDQAQLYSRNRKPQNARYPEIAEALGEQARLDLVADGEVVAFEDDATSFARLQGRIQVSDPERARRSGIEVFLYLFDLLELDGRDVRSLPLRERKRLLAEAIDFRDPIRFSEHVEERGEQLFEEACRRGWEGVIAKRADAPYPRGRSRDWLKFKCEAGQEMVIVGFTEPRGSRTDFGAVLVAYNEPGTGLRFAGKVGTGFDNELLASLGTRLRELETPDSPLADPREVAPLRGVHWVEPELVAEIGFSEWTPGGRLRHPRFQGLRTDKSASEVIREPG